MKQLPKRAVSLLLVCLLVVSGFHGFGGPAARAQAAHTAAAARTASPESDTCGVFWGTPLSGYLFENQTLFYPLDTAGLTDRTGCRLELDCGYRNAAGDFISLGSGLAVPQYDTLTGTQIIGVFLDGAVLHAAAQDVWPEEDGRFSLLLAARVYADGVLCHETLAACELRRTYAEYRFCADETLLTDAVPMEFSFAAAYDLFVQSGCDDHRQDGPCADGVWETASFHAMEARVLVGDGSAVRLAPNVDGSAWILSVAPNFTGKIEILQTGTDRLDPTHTLRHTFVLTFVNEIWEVILLVDEPQLLPGQQRTVTACAERTVCDPQTGRQTADSSAAVVDFSCADARSGISFVYDNPLTVIADRTAAFGPVTVDAVLTVGGVTVAESSLTLEVTDSLYAFVSAELPPTMLPGQTVTVEPELHYFWLDDARTVQSRRLDTGYRTEYWLEAPIPGLTVNGAAVQSGDSFPPGTTFTYTHTAAESTGFFIDAYDTDGAYLNSCYCYTVTRSAPEGANRLSGNSRYETSFGIANEYKSLLGAEKFENIIVTSGENFPDALAGSYLAAVKNAPIIMARVKNGALLNGAELKAYINENLADGGTVYVLGGNTAIPYTLETELAGLPLTRLEGRSRYDTNLLILNEAGITGDTLLVCTGKDYADALSASATGLPILLVDGEGTLRAEQKEFIEQHDFSNIYILGGPVAVNESYDAALAELGGTVTRLAGASRRATSVLVAETFFTNPTAAVIAYSDNFPDGLCGGPLANALGAPVLLTKTAIPTEAITYAQQNGIVAGYVLGGSGLVSDDVALDIFGLR